MGKVIFILLLILSFISIRTNAQINLLNKGADLVISDTPFIYTSAEVMPQFPGGDTEMMNYIGKNLKYSDLEESTLTDNSLIVVRFIVRETGEIDNITIVRVSTKSVEVEVIRLIKSMPNWIPGKNKGENVACYFTLPIHVSFRIE